ncbi:MAG: hypothetical protein ABIG64_00660 [Candidatus Omnitrophota bacterium]
MQKLYLSSVIFLGIIFILNIALAQEGKKIPLARVPLKVMDAAKKAVFAIDIREAELVTDEKGEIVYEFEGKKDMKTYEIQISQNGELIRYGLEDELEQKEKNINKLSKLPAIIRKSVKQAKPGILIHDFSAEKDDGQLIYKVQGAVNFEKYEIDVNSKGEILEIEKKQ